jgi:hypothetical protein
MLKWHWYVKENGEGYWSTSPPYMTKDRYLAYIMAAQSPLGPPTCQSAPRTP